MANPPWAQAQSGALLNPKFQQQGGQQMPGGKPLSVPPGTMPQGNPMPANPQMNQTSGPQGMGGKQIMGNPQAMQAAASLLGQPGGQMRAGGK